MNAVAELAAGSALEVLRRRFPDIEVDAGRRHGDRPAIGGFTTRGHAREAWAFTPDRSGYVIPSKPDRDGRYWLVPAERYRSGIGYLLPGVWNSWSAPRWDGGAS